MNDDLGFWKEVLGTFSHQLGSSQEASSLTCPRMDFPLICCDEQAEFSIIW